MAIHPPVGIPPGDPLERMGHALLGIAQYLEFATERCRSIAEVIFKLAGRSIIIDE